MRIQIANQFLERNRWLPWLILFLLSTILAIAALILFPVSPTIHLNTEETAWLSKHKVIYLAPNPNFPPIEYFSDSGEYSGLVADYYKILAKNLNIHFEFKKYNSWSDVLDSAEKGDIDGITATQLSVQQQKYLKSSSPLIDIPNVIVTTINWTGPLTLKEMNGWTIAIPKGYANEEFVRVNNPYITIKEADTDLQALQMVSFERANSALINQAVASYLIEQYGITKLRIAGDSGKSNPLSIAIRSDEPQLLSIMNKGLASITSKQKMDINQHWIGLTNENLIHNSQFWIIIFWVLLIVTFVLGVILIWNNTLRVQVETKTEELNQELNERISAEQKVSQQVENLSALRAVGVAINASMDLPLTLNIFLDQVSSKLKVDACSILLLNQYTRNLEYAAGKGFQTSITRNSTLVLSDNTYALQAVQTRKLVIENLQANPGRQGSSPTLEKEGFVSYIGAPLISKGVVKGVMELFNRTPIPIESEWMDFLEAMAAQAAIALDNATLFESLQRANLNLTLAYDATIEGWAKALELKDGTTEGHSQRVTQMTLNLAIKMKIRNDDLVHIRRGALLHDIGKMGIPDYILLKPGPLSPDEWVIMKKHPVFAMDLLKNIPYLAPALDIPYSHHEKWNGSGYPQGLHGERIPLAARVFCIVDVWDALTSDRPYRKAWDNESTLNYIKDNSGIHFDPAVAEEFLLMIQH
jgi:HD-GYP domain-containing protein (c-di-GMP phosphodiesterase class II)/ABC-type amino acid transport substrate-binding protein